MRDILQTWVELLRSRSSDQAGAYRYVQEAARKEVREAAAEYDAFIPGAAAVKDGLLIGTATSSDGSPVPLRLPWSGLYTHWEVIGGTGTGKTTWVVGLLTQLLERGRSFAAIDFKGDLFEAVNRILAGRPDCEPTIVNPFSDRLIPLNVCRVVAGSTPETQAYEITLALSRLFEASLGLHMETILRHLVLLLIESELSLVEAPLVLSDDVLRGVLVARSKNPRLKEFFLRTYPIVPQISKDALLARLQGLLFPEGLRLMLGAEQMVDLRGVFESRSPLVVFLGKGPGVPEELVEVIGSLFIQLLLQAAYSRGTGQRSRYLVVLDEFFHLLEAPGLARRFATALTTARSYGLSLMLVHHNFAQLPPDLRDIILGNCDLVALFRTNAQNAAAFGEFLPRPLPDLNEPRGRNATGRDRQTLEDVQRLPDRTAFWYDRRKRHRAVRVRVPDIELPRPTRRASLADHAAVSRVELRLVIDARRRKLAALLQPRITVRGSSPAPPVRAKKPAQRKGRPSLG